MVEVREDKEILVEENVKIKDDGNSVVIYVTDMPVAEIVGYIKTMTSKRTEKREYGHPKILQKIEEISITTSSNDVIDITVKFREEVYSDEVWSNEKSVKVELNNFIIHENNKKKYPWQ